MAKQWGWSEFAAAGPYQGEIITWPDVFDTKALAQEHLRLFLENADNPTLAVAARKVRKASESGGSLLVTCPPTHAWFVYKVAGGLSTGQAAAFYVTDHEEELWRRLLKMRENSATDDPTAGKSGDGSSGCAVVALSVVGAAVAVWARARWGA